MSGTAGGVLSDRADRIVARIVVAGGMVALALAWIYIRRGQFFDSLDIEIMTMFHSGNWLTPYHGHLSILPVALDKVLYATAGTKVIWPYTVVALAIYLAVPLAVYVDYRDRVARLLAALAAVSVVWMWPTQDNLRFNFMINFYLPVIMYLLARRFVDRGTRRGDAYSAIAVTVGLCSSSVGVVALVGLAAELIARRTPKRILWYVPSGALWALWYLTMSDSDTSGGLGSFFHYLWETTVAIFSGFTLGWRPGGILVLAALGALLAVAHFRWHTVGPRTLGLAAALVAFVASTALARAGEAGLTTPNSPRYIWLGNVLLVLIALECFTGRRVSWRTIGVATALTAIGAVAMFADLRANRVWFFYSTDSVIQRLMYVEAAPVDAKSSHERLLYGAQSTTGEYKNLVADLGSPIEGTSFADRGGARDLRANDHRLVRVENITSVPSARRPSCPSGWRPAHGHRAGEPFSIRGGTTVFAESGPDRRALLRARRFAHDFHDAPGWWTDAPGAITVRFPVDESGRPWVLRIDGAAATAQVCDESVGPSHSDGAG